MLLDKNALQQPRKRTERQMFLRERWQTFLQFTSVMRSEKGQHKRRVFFPSRGVHYEVTEKKALCGNHVRPSVRPSVTNIVSALSHF